METHIIRDWWLRSDKYGYIVARKVGIKSGKNQGCFRWSDEFYANTLLQVVVGLLERGIRASEVTSLAELADAVETLKTELKEWSSETDTILKAWMDGDGFERDKGVRAAGD